MTIKPDPSKQTAECGTLGKEWYKCPNIRTRKDLDMEKETYECPICGAFYQLYYEGMR